MGQRSPPLAFGRDRKSRNNAFWEPGRGLILTAIVILGWSGPLSFGQDYGYALLIQQSPVDGGTVDPKVGVHSFGVNELVTITAAAAPGYQFMYWLGDVSDPSSMTTTVVLSGPKIIVAVFDRVAFEFMLDEEEPPEAGIGQGGFGAAGRNFWIGGGGGPTIPRRPSGPPGPTMRYPTLTEEPIVAEPGDEVPVPIPEPATLALLGVMALAALYQQNNSRGITGRVFELERKAQ